MNLLIIDNGLPINQSLVSDSPLGGSETSIFFLGKGVAELGEEVTLICNTPKDEKVDYNYTILNIKRISNINPNDYDVILFNRVEPFHIESNAKKIYYTGDAYDQPLMEWVKDKRKINLIDKILCVSKWQMKTFIKYLNIPVEKLDVLGNSINSETYMGNEKRDPNKYIFASIPYKGLEYIPKIYDNMKRISKNDDLYFVLYSSMGLYQQSDEQYADLFHELELIKGIEVRQPVAPNILARELLTSIGYIHPNVYHETFGMILVQAQLCGCVPISTNKGAVPEVIVNEFTGLITDFPNIENHDCMKQFVNYALHIQDYNIDREFQIEYCKQWHYKTVAERFMGIVQ